jgi:hypothetical protein
MPSVIPKNERVQNRALEVQRLSIPFKITGNSSSMAPSAYAVLGATTVTNTGSSVLTGNVGLYPGTSITGFPPGTASGTITAADSASHLAQNAALAAYNAAQALSGATDLSGQDLGGMTLVAGVYKFSSSAQLTGTLTLDGQGNANAKWTFQIGSTLTTASASSVVLTNSGNAGNVLFAVGSSATLGTTTTMRGNITAQSNITMNTGATLSGSAVALTGAVTLDTNTVTVIPGSHPTPLIVVVDEQDILYIKTAGHDSITAVIDGSAPLVAPVNSTGTFSLLFVIKEPVVKVMQGKIVGRLEALDVNMLLDNVTGISNGGDQIILTVTTGIDFGSGSNVLDGCAIVEYITKH